MTKTGIRFADLNPIERFATCEKSGWDQHWVQRLAPVSHIAVHRDLGLPVDDGAPLRLEASHPGEELRIALSWLDALDDAAGKFFSRWRVYLLEDDGLPARIRQSNHLLEVLSLLGLVYRFSVALKFRYENVNQLRINSWGKLLVKSRKWESTHEWKEAYAYGEECFSSQMQTYLRLVTLCNSTTDNLQVHEIHRLNEIVSLRLVA